jgi:translocation and assembly module TamA
MTTHRLLGLAVCLLVACAHDPEAVYVKKLTIDGNKGVGDGAIKGGLATKELSWWPFSERRPFDELHFQRDLTRVETFYKTRGYFDIQLEDPLVQDVADKRLKVTVPVVEGTQYLVASVDVIPADLSDRVARVAKDITDLVEKPFNQQKYLDLKQEYQTALLNSGYCDSEVSGQVVVDRHAKVVRIRLIAQPGPLCFLGGVMMRGDVDIGTPIILGHSRLRRGLLVTPEMLRKSERSIYALGLFSLVRLEITTGDESPDAVYMEQGEEKVLELPERDLPPDVGPHKRVHITLYLLRKPPREFTVGGGGGFDRARQQARLRGGWSHRNFLGGLRTLSLGAVVGYSFMPTAWEPITDGPTGELKVRFIQPGFLEPALTLVASAAYALEFEEAFQCHAPKVRLGLERPLSWDLKAELNFEVVYYDFFNVLGWVRHYDDNPLGYEFVDPYLLTVLTQALTWDARDHPLVTRNGAYASVSFGQALHALGSGFQFLKVVGDLRGYYSPWGWLTLAGRVMNGYAWGVGDDGSVPITARFLAGGANSVRGFDFQRLSPYVERCVEGSGCERVPVGGLSLAMTQLETRFHLPFSLSTVLFVDVGNVFAEEYAFHPAALTVNTGLGLRYLTLVGPIRLDFAFRVNDFERYSHLSRWTFYLTLGEAF